MKKITLLFLLFTAFAAKAQTVTIGTGTATNYKGPITSFWKYGATEMIYLGSELNTTGNITTIGWSVATAATEQCNPVYIYMKTTSATSLATSTTGYPATTAGGYTLVYTGTGHDNATGWQTITLDTPFPFNDTTQNLQILCVNMSGQYWTQYPEYRYSVTTDYQCAVYYSNTLWVSGTSNLTPSTQRYNVQVGFAPPASTAPAVTGFSPAVACAGSSVTINGSGFTGATAVTVGGTPVTSYTVNSATQITAVVGSGMSGAIAVTTANGTGTSAADLAVTTTPAPEFADDAPIVCHATALNLIAPPDAEITWYAAATGGTALAGTTTVTDGTYYAAQTVDGCQSIERTAVHVSLNVVEPPIGDAVQSFCNSGTIGDLVADGVAFWYDAATGGNMLPMDTPLDNLDMYYASRSADGCESTSRLAVQAILSFASIDTPENVSACDTYTLPELEYGHYFTQPGGTGTMIEEGATISETSEIYIYADDFSNPDCTAEAAFTVFIHTAGALGGEHQQIFEAGGTVADLVVTADGGGFILWYLTLEDALNGVNPVSIEAELIDGHEYFATLTIGDCTSEPYGVIANIPLANAAFNSAAFTYHPNPVNDMLMLSYSSDITVITVTNLLGQQVLSAKPNTSEASINMSSLTGGTYFVKVSAGNAVKTIKVIKQ